MVVWCAFGQMSRENVSWLSRSAKLFKNRRNFVSIIQAQY